MIRVVLLLVTALAAASCQQNNIPVKTYAMRGVVQSVDPAGKAASIAAEKIEGWMEAMTMDYPVKSAEVLSGIQAGDRITATVHVRDTEYWIDNIKKQ